MKLKEILRPSPWSKKCKTRYQRIKAETLSETQVEVKAMALLKALADTLAEIDAKSFLRDSR